MAFMDKDFLLKNKTARELFSKFAEQQPIFDYHCHLSPKSIFEDTKFSDITEVWLGFDHYKWKAMRSAGIEEFYITGNADSFSKFLAFAKTIQYAIGNPIYHWAHLELQRYFDIYEPLTEKTAKLIFDTVNEKLGQDEFSVRNLIKKSNVNIIYTTDDPIDTLEYHKKIAEDNTFDVKVFPAFRPDKAINIALPSFSSYIKEFEKACDVKIKSYSDLLNALDERIDFFDKHGCKASDHGFTSFPFEKSEDDEVEHIFAKAMNDEKITTLEADKYRTAVLIHLAEQYNKKNWAMEIHTGVLRNTNTSMFEKIGADTGFDTIGEPTKAENLARFLDSVASRGILPKTILFNANPNDNYMIGSMIGCFQTWEVPSKIQFGTAWWFNDNIDGMTQQIKTLGNLSVLGKFIGMLTDSRSFLSYPRHEYFRRILCNIIGEWIENGEYIADDEFLEKLIKGICYGNAVEYFGE